MDTPGSSSSFNSSKRGRKLRQCSGKRDKLQYAIFSHKIYSFTLLKGDSTKSEATELSSESDFDPNSSFQKGDNSRRRCDKQKSNGLKFASLAYESSFEDGEHKSAFLPYKVKLCVINSLFIKFYFFVFSPPL